MEREHAVVEFGLDLIFVDALRQLERAQEAAVSALDDLKACLVALLSLEALLSSNRQYAILGGDFDVIRIQTRQLDIEPDLRVIFLDINRWCPAIPVAREGVFEQPVDLAPEPENRGTRRHPVKHFRLLLKRFWLVFGQEIGNGYTRFFLSIRQTALVILSAARSKLQRVSASAGRQQD